LGCQNIKTYIQSGNAVFDTKVKNKNKIADEIGSRILEVCGFKPKIFLLKIEELQEAVRNNPFETGDGKTLHFFFLSSQPDPANLEKLTAIKSHSEEFKLEQNVFYLYAPYGIGMSKLAAKAEQALGVPVTARNWNTINKLIEMTK
jgi:uncharacterized protein (DUF1697 family)